MSQVILAKFTSLHDETAKDFDMVLDSIIVGRKKECQHRILNTKVSGKHCSITADKDSGIFTLIDLSTNGTFVNGQKIPSGEPFKISSGDKIYLLNDEAEGTKVGFVFVQKLELKESKLGQKRKKSDMEVEEDKKEVENNEGSKRLKRADTPAIVQQIR